MFILSTTRLTAEIEQQLTEDFSDFIFKYTNNIEEAEKHLTEADILLTYGSDITVKHIQVAESLKWIMVLSAGIDQMPIEEIQKRDILLTNVRGIHKTQMAEYALAMLLNHYQKLTAFYERQKDKIWDKTIQRREITGRTITIVGAGSIGEELARLAKAFQMKTIAVTNSGGARPNFDYVYKQDALKEAVAEADFVVSILPGTKETEGYYKEKHFKWMKETAVFLNIGRGTAVDEETLLKALDNGEIEHAILDVTPIEPLPSESHLWSHDKVTLTPHVSGGSDQYIPRAMKLFHESLKQFSDTGTVSINKINLSRGY